jgi:hypothetical protein
MVMTNMDCRLPLVSHPWPLNEVIKPMQPRFTTEQSRSAGKATLRACWTFGLLTLVCACNSSTGESPLRGAASTVGWATTVPEAKDFVRASRPTTELAYVPVGRGGEARAVSARTITGVRDLEAELDRTRDQREATARRALPGGAYGRALPSVARPPTAAPAASGNAPSSYPVNPNRLRQLRENSRDATER